MEWLEFEKKLLRWDKFTKNNWWLSFSGRPLLFQFLWKLKLQVRPPYFANPFLFAAGLGTFLGLSMLVIEENRNHLGLITISCLGIGGIISVCFWIEAKIRKLPRWEDI